MTIPTTNKAITETPANTPKPIGRTSSFFPGGPTAAAAPTAVGDGDGDKDGLTDELMLSGRGPVGVPGPFGFGVAVGFGTEETPMTTTGTPEDGTTMVLVPVLPGGGDTELLPPDSGTEVSVTDTTGGMADTELAGGNPVIVGFGGTVLEDTPVLGGTLVLERTSVVPEGILEVPGGISVTVLDRRPVVLGGAPVDVEVSVSLVLVKVGGEVEVGGGNTVDTLELDAGGRAPGTSPFPLSGVSTQDFSSLTMSTPFTTVGVRVIVHV